MFKKLAIDILKFLFYTAFAIGIGIVVMSIIYPSKPPVRNLSTDGYHVLNGERSGQFSNLTVIAVSNESGQAVYLAYFAPGAETITEVNGSELGVPIKLEKGVPKKLVTSENINIGTVTLIDGIVFWDPPQNVPISFMVAAPPAVTAPSP